MALNYAKLAATAQRLIDTNGQAVTFYHVSHEPTDPAKPWRGAGSETTDEEISAIGVVVPNDEIDDKEGQRRGDAIAYVASLKFGLDVDPTPEDMVKIDRMVDSDGYTWHVHGVHILNPGGVRILYECILEH